MLLISACTCLCNSCMTFRNYCSFLRLQDEVKLKVRKRSDPIEPDVINNMVRYARKSIQEFRALKHIRYIL